MTREQIFGLIRGACEDPEDTGTIVEKHELWSLAGLGLNLGPDFTSYLILRLSE